MIHRADHSDNYMVISNRIARDERLSFEARGFLVFMLSMSDDWNFSIKGLVNQTGMKRSVILRMVKELRDCGYILIKQETKKDGKFTAKTWELYENCTVVRFDRSRSKPQSVKTDYGKTETIDFIDSQPQSDLTVVGENRSTVLPQSVKTVVGENGPIRNTNIERNTKEKEDARVLSDVEKLFLEFWTVYPKKVDKKGAFRAFKNIKKLKEVFPEIMSALEVQKRSEQWTKANGQYIPNPTTYIHQERWTTTTEADEIKANLDQMFLENINQFNPWRRKDA